MKTFHREYESSIARRGCIPPWYHDRKHTSFWRLVSWQAITFWTLVYTVHNNKT